VDSEVDDIATLTLQLAGGQIAEARSSWNAWRPDDHLLVRGRRGEAQVDCWRNTLTVRCEGALPLQGRRTCWNGDEAVEVSLGTYDQELLKLELLLAAISSGHSNLDRVDYAMRLILSIPSGGGSIPLPRDIYGESDQLAALQFGDAHV
jgi:hypothetical protein